MQIIALVGMCLVLAVMAGCGSGENDAVGMTPAMILDATSGGTEGFYFLAPLVDQPMPLGPFDPTLVADLKVDVFLLDSIGAPTGGAVASFTDSGGANTSETIRVCEEDEHYIVNFHTKRYDLINGQTYRIFVNRKSDGAEYGFADVLVVKKKKDARGVADDATFVLKNGRTLPIKFRIEKELKIMFASRRGGVYNIYSIDPDEPGLATKLTPPSTPAGECTPWPLPDGSVIAFSRYVDSSHGWELFVLDANGERRLTYSPGWDGRGSVSPDGLRVVYESEMPRHTELHIANADGSGSVQLTDCVDNDGHAEWSPDGSHIVWQRKFHGGASAKGNIWVVDPNDPENAVKLTEDTTDDAHPSWSPDGTKVLFSRQEGGVWCIWEMSADVGSDDERRVYCEKSALDATYSPDGSRIVFIDPAQTDIFIIDADGGSPAVNVTKDSHTDANPQWYYE